MDSVDVVKACAALTTPTTVAPARTAIRTNTPRREGDELSELW